MKKKLSLATFLLFAVGSQAQTINVHKTNGTTVKYMASEVDFIDFSTPPLGVEAVDLGLPSGTKWANMNVGAEKPEESGNYFAWGETEPKENYSWGTYKFVKSDALTKYTGSDKTVLDPEDDAATANWGEGWRMPTKDEINELLDNTTNEWTELNGVKGRKFTAKNGSGNFIFVPALGSHNDGSLKGVGSFGSCWSSSLSGSFSNYAYDLFFSSGSANRDREGIRYYGRCVRPVRPE